MSLKIKDMVITIVGVGQIGGSFALALKKNQIGKKIIGVDKKKIIEKLKKKKIVDYSTFKLKNSIEEADLIFLSIPVDKIIRLLPEIVSCMKPNAILLDSGSTKNELSLLMKKFADNILIGGHPMAGTEKSGFEAANHDLFKNKIFALNFPTETSLKGKKIIYRVLEKIGAIPLEINAETHDFIVTLTSHIPYILSLSLSSLAKDYFSEDFLFNEFVATGFLGATRLSLTNEEMGTAIVKTNSDNIIKMIDEFKVILEKIRSLIANNQYDELKSIISKITIFQSKINNKYGSYN